MKFRPPTPHTTQESRPVYGESKPKNNDSDRRQFLEDFEIQKKFDEVLRDQFSLIPDGVQFTSELKGIRSMSLIKSPDEKSAFIYVIYKNQYGQNLSKTLTLTGDGILIGASKFLSELPEVSRNDLMNEIILNFIACKKTPDLFEIECDLFSESDKIHFFDGDEVNEHDSNSSSDHDRSIGVSREVTEFINALPGRIGKATPKGKGMKEYCAVIFDGFVIADSNKSNNALYIFSINLPATAEELITMVEEDIETAKELIKIQLTKSKHDMRVLGAQRIFHTGAWKKRLLDAFADWKSGRAQEKRDAAR
jgi:hypothetical protein